MKQKNILITDKQEEFVAEQRKGFNFSKFVRGKLDEYIKFKRGLNEKKVN